MKYQFIDEEFAYTGEALSNHWIYKNFGILGDAVVSFVGPCDIDKQRMVDLEDVLNDDRIYSTRMLNFMIEIFDMDLREGVILQRLFSAIIQSRLIDLIGDGGNAIKLRRVGDDLFVEDTQKLSVSICTVTPTSIVMHVGLNIQSEGAPVEAAGLSSELGLQQIKPLALSCMKTLAEEWEDIKLCCCKVKAVV
jgi:hypothetical protein